MMRYCTTLFVLFFSLHYSYSQEIKKTTVQFPEAPSNLKRQNLVVSVSGKDKIFIAGKEIPALKLDSILQSEINIMRSHVMDTVTVVITADTSTLYITVFRIMQSAKKARARVVANINTESQ